MPSNTPKKIFDTFVTEARNDSNFLGLFLTGSRGKGFEHEQSDYDVGVVVQDKVYDKYKKRFDNLTTDGIDIMPHSLSDFREHAEWNGLIPHWECYSYAHVKALVDKTGEIQKLIDEKGSIPSDKRDDFINISLDAYLNGFFRSVKSHLRADEIGIRLESAQSIQPVLNALFALESRLAPYPDYLERELHVRPLTIFPYDTDEILGIVGRILISPDLQIQQNFCRDIETALRKAGFHKVFDDWEEKLPWAMKI